MQGTTLPKPIAEKFAALSVTMNQLDGKPPNRKNALKNPFVKYVPLMERVDETGIKSTRSIGQT